MHAFTVYTADGGASRSGRENLKQVHSFTYLGGAVTETLDMSVKIARWTRACGIRIRWYLREFYDQPKVALFLKTQTVKIDAIEAVMYGIQYVNHSPRTLRQTPHRTSPGLASHNGAECKSPYHRMTMYDRVLEITRCESIDTT